MTSLDRPPSLDEALARDHERIDALFSALGARLKDPTANAADPLAALDRSLRYHMHWEEEILFPSVQAAAPGRPRLGLDSLLADHDRIRDTLERLRGVVEARDSEAARDLHEALRVFLIGHNRDEEHGVYAVADRVLPPHRRRSLLETFRPPR